MQNRIPLLTFVLTGVLVGAASLPSSAQNVDGAIAGRSASGRLTASLPAATVAVRTGGTGNGSKSATMAVAPVVIGAFPPDARPRPGRDQFLDIPVDTTEELVAALKKNATLRKNFAKHFSIAEPRVVEFVRDALVPMYLRENQVVTNYGVTKNGRIYGKKTVLKKGTKVWATRSGDPILKWQCSNPLTVTMPGTTLRERPKPVASIRPSTSRVRDLGMLPEMSDTLVPPQIQLALAEPEVPLPPDQPEIPVIPGVAEAPEVAGEVISQTGRVGVNVPLNAITRVGVPLTALALVARLTSTGTSSNVSGNVIPEPETIALASLGALGLIGIARRKKTR